MLRFAGAAAAAELVLSHAEQEPQPGVFVAIEAALFREPAPPGMGDLLPMVGEWAVKVERRQQPGAPFTVATSLGSPEASSTHTVIG